MCVFVVLLHKKNHFSTAASIYSPTLSDLPHRPTAVKCRSKIKSLILVSLLPFFLQLSICRSIGRSISSSIHSAAGYILDKPIVLIVLSVYSCALDLFL